MWHKIAYTKNGVQKNVESSLECEGKDRQHTAMAMTVGLPLAMACKLILEGKIEKRGCLLPISSDFYLPILEELEEFGIQFIEKRRPLTARARARHKLFTQCVLSLVSRLSRAGGHDIYQPTQHERWAQTRRTRTCQRKLERHAISLPALVSHRRTRRTRSAPAQAS